MKKLFLAIRYSNFDMVKKLIERKPYRVNFTAKSQPKKDAGQSPLQVAYKTGNFDIANYLIAMGANVNWIEENEVNEWKAPVIHDAIRATIFSSRFPVSRGRENSLDDFNKAFRSLENLIEKGANVHAQDSYGNNCAMRAVLDIRQFNDRMNSEELVEDLRRVVILLKKSGVNFYEKTEKRGVPLELLAGQPAMKIFN